MPDLLAVITVNLNHAAGLRATAASIAEQTRPPDEWLVIDGGSTDGSLAVIREFEHRIEHWSSAPDCGVYDAMNQGLRHARAAYVIFMNAGDRFAGPDTLARVAGLLESRPGLDLLFGGTYLDLPCRKRLYRPPRTPVPRLRHGLPAYHQATVVRRAAHLIAPFDPALRVSADYGAVATLISRGARSVAVDLALAIRECSPESLSERETATRFADFITVQRRILGLGRQAVAINLGHLALVYFAYRTVRGLRWSARRGLLAPPIDLERSY